MPYFAFVSTNAVLVRKIDYNMWSEKKTSICVVHKSRSIILLSF